MPRTSSRIQKPCRFAEERYRSEFEWAIGRLPANFRFTTSENLDITQSVHLNHCYISPHLNLLTPNMAFLRNRANSFSDYIQTAEARIVSQRRWLPSNYKLAYVLVSSRIYWKVAREDRSNEPRSLYDFRSGNSLEFARLHYGTWNDVAQYVKVGNNVGKMCITARGRLHGRERRNKVFIFRDVEIEIILNSPEQREVFVNSINLRVAPWNLLQQEFKNPAHSFRSSEVKKLGKVLDELLSIIAHIKSSSVEISMIGKKWPVRMSMYSTAIPPRMGLFGRGGFLNDLKDVVESIEEIMTPSRELNEIDVEFAFDALRQTVSIMDKAEKQLLRSRVSQIIHAGDVKELEMKAEDLLRTVRTSSALSKIYRMGEGHHSKEKQVIRVIKLRQSKRNREFGMLSCSSRRRSRKFGMLSCTMCVRHSQRSFLGVLGNYTYYTIYWRGGGVRL